MRNEVIINVEKDIDMKTGSSLYSYKIDYGNGKMIRIVVKHPMMVSWFGYKL